MCTLTYIPINPDCTIITSNRDESLLREKAVPPTVYFINNIKVAFPKDPAGGGTWIATSEKGLTVCLLNGAFEPHVSTPPYRKSRGLILLEVFKFNSPLDFIKKINLDGIEPFTLVIFSKNSVNELKWTGDKKHYKNYDPLLPHLWASEQLYSKENILKRKKWFGQLLQTNQLNQNTILNFHENAGEGDVKNDLKIKRADSLSTLSITSVKINSEIHEMYYKDLVTNDEFNYKVK